MQITTEKDMPPEAWDYMRDMGFFSMKIPKEWGGKGFSTHAVSTVLAKIATHCPDANATVAVPNSLGPGELLVRYGTDEQKGYFLPRLADGTLIPCFGLTGPHNGSDATALQGAFGIVERRNGELGIRATFRKRYITLAPVAGVVGVGFDLQDPDALLGGVGEQGFTVALLERGHEGLRMGPRHMPLNCAFMNGTVEGDDVWIPMTSVLGGQQRCGFGWHMMIEALAEGRGVSLPAGSIGAAKSVVSGVGAYARIRKQFKVPIAEFGGIQEALGRCGREAYAVLAGVELTNAIIDNHEAPMVLSSIMKQTCTERGRKVVQDGMDILGGAGICRGEANFVGNSWMSMPVGITVEGANIMTRSFMIIGQGVTRCHPHMLPLIASLQSDEADAPAKFRAQFLKMVGHVLSNFGLGVARALSSTATTAIRSSTAYKGSPDALVSYHEAQLARLSANFAFASDLALLLGGRLKYEELLMGRLADMMGAIFLGYATLHHFKRNATSVHGLNVLAESTLLQLEHEAQAALRDAAANFPRPLGAFGGWLLTLGTAPLGAATRPYRMPGDELTKELTTLLTTPSAVHELFKRDIYTGINTHGNDTRLTKLLKALPVVTEADALERKLKKERRQPTSSETELLESAVALRDELVQVDVHEVLGLLEEQPGYVRPAILSTQRRQQGGPTAFDETPARASANVAASTA